MSDLAELRQRRPVKPQGEAAAATSQSQTAPLASKAPQFLSKQLFPLMTIRIAAAIWSPIPDCDETFNYWEPVHFLLYGSGLQTWEYSPEFALRSYLYVLFHVVIGKALQLMGVELLFGKVGVFYGIRIALGLTSAFCEYRLARAVERRFGRTVSQFFDIFLLLGTGMFHSSVAMLPQSFTMYSLMLATEFWMDRRDFGCIFFVAVAGLIGWPFAAVPAVPIAADLLLRAPQKGSASKGGGAAAVIGQLARLVLYAVVSALVCLVPSVLIDYHYYHKWLIAVVNIALYNSATAGDDGSNLYGVEPWHYYQVNLFLNFNVAWLLALVAPLLALLVAGGCARSSAGVEHDAGRAAEAEAGAEGSSSGSSGSGDSKQDSSASSSGAAAVSSAAGSTAARAQAVRFLVYSSPLYVWVGVMTAMPHKEERFLFIVYPLLCLAAAYALSAAVSWLRAGRPRTWLFSGVLSVFVALSLSRSVSLVNNYGAPLQLYGALARSLDAPQSAAHPRLHHAFLQQHGQPQPQLGDADFNSVCVGKEWYRFPGHFFLPEPYRLRFIDSNFTGLLPAPFAESDNATWIIPPNMNDRNRKEMDRFVALRKCAFIVDWDIPWQREPHYATVTELHSLPLDKRSAAAAAAPSDSNAEQPAAAAAADPEWVFSWQPSVQFPFLDAAHSPGLARAFHVPGLSARRNVYRPYQLLVRRIAPVTNQA